MINTSQFLSITAALAMSLGSTGIAQAATVSSSGVWTSISGSPSAGPFNVGTSKVSWGQAFGPQPSAYSFAGVTNETLPLDGNNFLLGTFTHENFVIGLPSITGANLALSLNIGNLAKTFNFGFNHNETPNNGNGFGFCPSTPGLGTPCPDIVSIPNAASTETVDIDGSTYQLVISGFQQNGALVNQFITFEDQSNSAQLFARLEKVIPPVDPEPIPEPLTILGTGTALGFGAFFKRKQSEAKKVKA